MKNRMTRFLAASLAMLCVFCIAIFTILTFYMNNKSTDTIVEVGDLYMAGLNKRITMHFEAIVDYHISHINTIVEKNREGDRQMLLDGISDNARVLNLTSLALYSVDGEFELLYGDEMEIANPKMFLKEMLRGNQCVAAGSSANGEALVLVGVPYICEMAEGGKSVALVGGLAQDYFARPLALNENGELVYSHIIRRDGSFVVRSGDAVRDNYFDRIEALYDPNEGGKDGAKTLIQNIRTAMNFEQDFSGIFPIQSGDKRHLYITRLPDSDWYLVTVMPYGTLDQKVRSLSETWGMAALICCLMIILALILIFSRYFSILRHQMLDLKEARESAEKARQAAESANHAKSEFLSNMSHDIRTPMNAIVGMTAIATANIDNKEYVKNCLRKITLSSRHLLGLINDVLDMSKIENGKMTLSVDQVSLREVMDSIVSISQPQVRAKDQSFNIVIQDIITENVCCDSVRLNQVLLNLISNAIKYTQKGGKICLQLDQSPSPKGDAYVRTHFCVKDNGIGMPEEFIAHIFDSFSREDNARVRKTEGTGLGMAITKYIVDTMGGQINVESKPGVGSTFDVILDLKKSIVQEENMLLPHWKILVVDDDPMLRESVGASLEEIGIQADWAMTGVGAVGMVEEHSRAHDDYHVILIDWRLPDIDGLETARRIRQCLGGSIPILLISTYDWSEIEEEAHAAGINGFIGKPLFKSTLYYGLKKYCMQDVTVAEKTVETDADFKGRKILVAEDNELNWEIADELLSDLGLELEWAEDGKICVEKFSASPVGYYDAILMDIRMPVMTGYEATHAIRTLQREDANIPIIAMTADAFAEDIKKCLESGMNAHIAKPIDVRDVAKQLKKFMK